MNFNAIRISAAHFHVPRATLLVMKITTLLLLISVMTVSASSFAQKITLSEKKASLEQVLKKIRLQSGYDFVYSDDMLSRSQPVTVDLKDATLDQALKAVLKDQPLNFEVEDGAVIFKQSGQQTILDKIKTALAIPVTVSGKVTDTTGTPLPGATIKLNGQHTTLITNKDGFFSFAAQPGDAVTVSFIGYQPYTFKVSNGLPFQIIVLHAGYSTLSEVNVSTGYQKINKERATGSFTFIDSALLNRRVGSNIIDRLGSITSGVLLAPTNNRFNATPSISVRGLSTILSDTRPLVVVDNFPYDGDYNNINPNDVQDITILKDAAAASIWGARAGNGVIVITTKKGKYNQSMQLTVNANTTIGDKPNLYALPQMSSTDMVDVQKYLFAQGSYDFYATYLSYYPIPSVAEILNNQKKGTITADQANQQLAALSQYDNRADRSKYFYQKSINQDYSISARGGGKNQTYAITGGFSNNRGNDVANSYNRFTLRANNTYTSDNKKLEILSTISFVTSTNKSGNTYTPSQPYERFVDANGNALAVNSTYLKSYTDTAGKGKLLDWSYRPLNERAPNSTTNITDYRLELGLNYRIINALKLGLNYQYAKGVQDGQTLDNQDSYNARNYINQFTQVSSTGTVTHPVPVGGIFSTANTTYKSHNGRVQLSFDQNWHAKHNLTAIAGAEIRDYNSFTMNNKVYGYDPATAQSTPVDYVNTYPLYVQGDYSQIDNGQNQSGSTNHFLSYFANAAYTYDDRFTLSGSMRRDESNIFGVATNQKGVPLWSAGGSWNLDKEAFYHMGWLPRLKLRLTDGYMGNVNTSLSSYLTTTALSNQSVYNQPLQQIANPPNPTLRWELVNTWNLGLDFGLSKNLLKGSIEVYRKNATDLIGDAQVPLQTGVSTFRGNNASLLTRGIDINLNFSPLQGKIKWSPTILFTYVRDKVTDYKYTYNSGRTYASYQTPKIGKPYSALYSYLWAGLDPQTGDPLGYLDGVVSKDWAAVLSKTTPDQLVYNGPATPPIFGSFRNDLSYGNFNLSINITYKLDYYFRSTSLNNSTLFSGVTNFSDYGQRWQKPGDELKTNVPSLIYPANSNRSTFYQYSSVLVEKADHIRLQDIKLNYQLTQLKDWGIKSLNIYAYANNLGIIWRANKKGLDPDGVGYAGSYYLPVTKTYALGVTANF